MDHDFTSDLRRTADTILSGRVVFESFAAAWPARAADRSGPPELVEFANWMLEPSMQSSGWAWWTSSG
jgi:hypothetical protein